MMTSSKKRLLNKVLWCRRQWYWPRYGFCPTEAAWQRELRPYGIAADYPKADGMVTSFTSPGGIYHLVTIGDMKGHTPIEIVPILAHEAMHICQYIFKYIGEKKPSKEFEAYTMQTVIMELLKAYSASRGPLFR